jgi:diaminohydroxyphosphoribosylaminopyrimidine deaminase/5-amino-6-(5-phosphoribosylamino)uracil reductase
VTVWVLPERDGRVQPRALARRLAAAGCHEVLMESGGELGAAWLAAGLVDRLALFTAPQVLGVGRSWSETLGARPLSRALRARLGGVKRVGDDLLAMLELEGRDVHRAG